jgi:UDP-glucose:(heptosyl)LPS alpha-1,3-glucosyltransferase
MNIIIAKKDMSTTKSAATNRVLEEAQYFIERGHSVRIIAEAMDRQSILNSGATPVKIAKFPISGYLRRRFFQLMADRYIKTHPADLVIGRGDIMQQNVLFVHNCTHLAYERINGSPIPESNAMARIHSKLLTEGRFDLLICNSAMMRDDFVSRFGIDISKTAIICPGIDISKFNINERAKLRSETRGSLNIPPEATVIGLITSGDFKKRNVDGMIRAFAALKDTDLRLLIAGKDNITRHKSLTEQLKIADRVVFAPAIPDVQRYYFAADIFILPAHIEEFGRSVAEAMYCGLPVVVSKWAGAADILEGEARNYILPQVDADTIATYLEKLLADRSAWDRLGALNHATAKRYTNEASMAELERLYHTL